MERSTKATPSTSVTQHSQIYRAIGWAGLLAGSLDITAALVESGLEGKSPVHLFQAIAGGLLGMASFQGGWATAALGAFFHFLIATTAAAVFYLASSRVRFLVEHAVPSGLLYGIVVYVFMYYFVLPLSAYHTEIALPAMPKLIRDVAVHMFMVGLPISLMVRKYSD
jgi:asparagine N-glycosylation enzyme membrane subunit Stt3